MKNLILSTILVVLLLFPQKLTQVNPPKPSVSAQELKKQLQCIHEAIYHEARGEPTEGIHAVMSVIYNRTKHPKFPSTYCGVVHQPYQFSYRNKTKQGIPVKTTYTPSELTIKATIDQLAFDAVVGRFKPSVESNVLFYHATKLKKIPKFNKNSKFKVIIGNHIFIGE